MIPLLLQVKPSICHFRTKQENNGHLCCIRSTIYNTINQWTLTSALNAKEKQWVNLRKKRELESLTFPKPETYKKFLDYANERSKFGNPDFIHLNKRLNGLSAENLQEKHAIWSRSCYSQLTHKGYGERYKTRYDKALSAIKSSVLKKEKVRPTSTSTTHDGSESADSI